MTSRRETDRSAHFVKRSKHHVNSNWPLLPQSALPLFSKTTRPRALFTLCFVRRRIRTQALNGWAHPSVGWWREVHGQLTSAVRYRPTAHLNPESKSSWQWTINADIDRCYFLSIFVWLTRPMIYWLQNISEWPFVLSGLREQFQSHLLHENVSTSSLVCIKALSRLL